jgi:hypothetical protein
MAAERHEATKGANKMAYRRDGAVTSASVDDDECVEDDKLMKVFTETVCLRQLFEPLPIPPASSPRSAASEPDQDMETLSGARDGSFETRTKTVVNPLDENALQVIACWFGSNEGQQWLTSKFGSGPCVSCPLQANLCVSCVGRLVENRLRR